VLRDILTFSLEEGYEIKGLARSPVLGPKGNVEFLAWLACPGMSTPSGISVEELVARVIDVK
jgi:23S rRNA (cytidine1920-2'-O)/16S rRNA (cytidine1409-2'-O)-methyltransferase